MAFGQDTMPKNAKTRFDSKTTRCRIKLIADEPAEVLLDGALFSAEETSGSMRKLLRQCRLFYLLYLSQPAGDRAIYRAVRRGGAKKVLEIGIGTGKRSLRIIELASRDGGPAEFIGIDLYEAHPAGASRISLKSAYAMLKRTRARARLVPGDAFSALARTANEIGPCDLIVISRDQFGEPLDRAWFYLPRLLRANTCVYIERAADGERPGRFELLSHDEIQRRAAPPSRRAA